MPLTDLLKTTPSSTSLDKDRTTTRTCEHFVPGAGDRCVSDLGDGMCARPDEFACPRLTEPKADQPAVSPAPCAGVTTPTLQPGSLLRREDVESFKRLGAEVEIRSPLGTFWLVPARTGKNRTEITPEDAITLVNVVHVFGGRITSLTRDGSAFPVVPAAVADAGAPALPSPLPAPTAADAREHLRRFRPGSSPATKPGQTAYFDKERAR